MEHTIEFERCIDFMTEMIEKYGAELLEELSVDKSKKEIEQNKRHE